MEHENAKPHVFPNARKPGELLFAILILIIALLLISQIGEQTTWLEGKGWSAQPRLWPLVGLGTMSIFGALHLWWTSRSRRTPGRWREALVWVSSLEYVLWYLIYVASVPYAGYLLSTVVFCLFLTWRAGYRSTRIFLVAALFGLGVVLFFKSALNVKIPGGAIYEYLPASARYFMLRYF
ncbi:tripartite tricarboxylate transporter TctB family protein [Pelagibacterium halotolerans]|uniref:tripartite tricarboxylate transporter TctB family protein n=1 Tax=Pelagibacterium halotolerans TaxID=531813 RepID=UPI00384D196A